jgi:hypothetical protein
MKKLLLFLTILILSQCQIHIDSKEAQAQGIIATNKAGDERAIKTFVTYQDGMTYRVFTLGSGYDGGGIHVINVTKEKLEIEKLKLEIKKLKL